MIDRKSTLGKFLSFVVSTIFILIFFAYPFELVGGMFLIAFLVICFKASTKKNFLKLQAILPTSKIRSMAMGLVEVQGKTKCQALIGAKLGSVKCIAYHYTVHFEETDSDNRKSSRLIEEELKIAPFSIKDDTAEAYINTDDLEFMWLPERGSYNSGSYRYTQRVLMPDDEVMLIGTAVNIDGKNYIQKDEINNVFNLTHASSVDKWNTYKPLLHSLYVFCALACVLDIAASYSDIYVDAGVVYFNINNYFR